MWYDLTYVLEKGLNYKYKNIQEETVFFNRIYMYYTTLSRYLVLWLHEAYFIMPIVAQVSDVARGPLVILPFWKADLLELFQPKKWF